MKIGDMVRYKGNPNSTPCRVIEIKDLGHGEGFERVKINLLGISERYYAMNELEVVKNLS